MPVNAPLCVYKQVKYVNDPGAGAGGAKQPPYYEFPLEYVGADDIVIDSDSFPILSVLEEYIQHDSFIQRFLAEFIDAHKALFAKKYSVNQLLKVTSHLLASTDENTGTMWRCAPVKVIFIGGKFVVYWKCSAIDVPAIDLGELGDTSRPQSPQPQSEKSDGSGGGSGLEDVTDVIHSGVATESVNPRSAEDIRKERERRKIYEARLRAKLAIFRAEKAAQKYVERYGEDLSVVDTDEESDSSDAYSEFSR